ncbi:MAG: hypothetical protein O2819_02245 [Planctomycetota bacterium]|nr:hypothetical protein [Planctomycetota bacterium]MDA1106308.1 hypothetical protein [Planctomycetota bacterium]
MQRISQPLFRIDPGWLFLSAGLLLIGASVLVPQEGRLHELREQLVVMERLEEYGERRVAAYDGFVAAVERADPAVIRRLAASQLRVIEPGYERVAEAASASEPVSSWVDAAVPTPWVESEAPPDSLLARWTAGRHQFWMGGLGAFSTFIGLVMGSEQPRRRRRSGAGGGLLGDETTETHTPCRAQGAVVVNVVGGGSGEFSLVDAGWHGAD